MIIKLPINKAFIKAVNKTKRKFRPPAKWKVGSKIVYSGIRMVITND